MSGRLQYLNRAITGRMNPDMASANKIWTEKTGQKGFTRLHCLWFALSRWTLIDRKNFFVILFPAGILFFHVKKDEISINCKMFSFFWYKLEKKK